MTQKLHFAALITVSFLSLGVHAQETEISLKDVPPKVLAAFDRTYTGVRVLDWEKEIHGGKVYFKAETIDAKISRNVLCAPDGSVAQVVEKIVPKDLPASITESASRLYPKTTIRSAQKITHADVVVDAHSLLLHLGFNPASKRRIDCGKDAFGSAGDGDVDTSVGERVRHLKAKIARPHDHRRPRQPVLQELVYGKAVFHRVKRKDAWQLKSLDRGLDRPRPVPMRSLS